MDADDYAGQLSQAAQILSARKYMEDRKLFQDAYGKVWDTKELQEDFNVNGFSAPYVVVVRKSDNKVGSLQFSHSPRFYFNWKEDK
jgi:hypothetical protein